MISLLFQNLPNFSRYRRFLGATFTRLGAALLLLAWAGAVLYVFNKFSVLAYAHNDLAAAEVGIHFTLDRDCRTKTKLGKEKGQLFNIFISHSINGAEIFDQARENILKSRHSLL